MKVTKLAIALLVPATACTEKAPQKLHYEVVPGPKITRDMLWPAVCDAAENLQDDLKKQKDPTPEVIEDAKELRSLACDPPVSN
jgi:hypothetical protein